MRNHHSPYRVHYSTHRALGRNWLFAFVLALWALSGIKSAARREGRD
jgi:hypothetical protein